MTSGYLSSFEPAMRLALDQAAGPPAGGDGADVPVGAVVLDGAGAVVAAGRNRREADGDPTALMKAPSSPSALRDRPFDVRT